MWRFSVLRGFSRHSGILTALPKWSEFGSSPRETFRMIAFGMVFIQCQTNRSPDLILLLLVPAELDWQSLLSTTKLMAWDITAIIFCTSMSLSCVQLTFYLLQTSRTHDRRRKNWSTPRFTDQFAMCPKNLVWALEGRWVFCITKTCRWRTLYIL